MATAASSASTFAPNTLRSSIWLGVQPAASASASTTSGASKRQAAAWTAARATSDRTSMSAHMCLTAWNEPMGLPNCCRSLAYATANSSAATSVPHLQSGGEQRALVPELAMDVRYGAAERKCLESPQRSEGVQRVLNVARPADGCGLQQLSLSVTVQDEQRVEHAEVLHQHRPRPARRVHADLHAALGGTLDHFGARREEGPDEWPGHEPAPQLLEHDGGIGQPEPGSGRLGQRQGEDAGLAERSPVVGGDGLFVAFAGAEMLERQPPGQHGPDALRQLALVVTNPEVHQRALGRPRIRSATMFRCT